MDNGEGLDDFKRWSVTALKDYLRKRALKVTGRKEELVALAFSAAQLNVKLKPDSKEEQLLKASEYRSLLSIEGSQLPDPISELKNDWMEEKEGVFNWPPTMSMDIAEYIWTLTSQDSKHSDLTNRLLTDYKEGKAYSYFDASWLGEVLFHPVSVQSKFCFLKAQCVPSENIRNIPHTCWVCINKSSGQVKSGYCTCFAGLGSTCNHVAAVLYKVDFAWRMGYTNRACTSRECQWIHPKKDLGQPARISEMQWRKPHHGKTGEKKVLNPPCKLQFNPTEGKKDEPDIAKLTNALFPSCPNACVFHYFEWTNNIPEYPPDVDFNVGQFAEVITTTAPPESLPEFASKFPSTSEFLSALPTYTDAEVMSLEKETSHQADNNEWFDQRKGRITASVSHQILTKVRTLQDPHSNRNTDTSSLVGRLLSQVSFDLPALKYGRMKEPEARKQYSCALKGKGHREVKVEQCGLFVDKEDVYIGASPDGTVSCQCCGEGLVEIKCPLSIAHEIPQNVSLAYLKIDHQGKVTINRNHAYYTQMQVQMGVTKRAWCDLFIFTSHGYHLERVSFDEERWVEFRNAAKYFFENYVAKELVCKTSDIIDLTECTVTSHENSTTEPLRDPVPTVSRPEVQLPSASRNVRKARRRGDNARGNALPYFICHICNLECKYECEIEKEDDNSVACDECHRWYHWGCVGFDNTVAAEWYCPDCEVASITNDLLGSEL